MILETYKRVLKSYEHCRAIFNLLTYSFCSPRHVQNILKLHRKWNSKIYKIRIFTLKDAQCKYWFLVMYTVHSKLYSVQPSLIISEFNAVQ